MASNLIANYIRPFFLCFVSDSNTLQPDSDGVHPTIAMASNPIEWILDLSSFPLFPLAMASNLLAMASNPLAMASNLIANYIRPFNVFFVSTSNGLQPTSDGFQPNNKLNRSFCRFFVSNSHGLQPTSGAARGSQGSPSRPADSAWSGHSCLVKTLPETADKNPLAKHPKPELNFDNSSC